MLIAPRFLVYNRVGFFHSIEIHTWFFVFLSLNDVPGVYDNRGYLKLSSKVLLVQK
jgi:hypothetical protein